MDDPIPRRWILFLVLITIYLFIFLTNWYQVINTELNEIDDIDSHAVRFANRIIPRIQAPRSFVNFGALGVFPAIKALIPSNPNDPTSYPSNYIDETAKYWLVTAWNQSKYF